MISLRRSRAVILVHLFLQSCYCLAKLIELLLPEAQLPISLLVLAHGVFCVCIHASCVVIPCTSTHQPSWRCRCCARRLVGWG
jgi:hypothetical protein